MSLFSDIIISFTNKFLGKWIFVHSISSFNKFLGLNGYNIFKFRKSQRGDFCALKSVREFTFQCELSVYKTFITGLTSIT